MIDGIADLDLARWQLLRFAEGEPGPWKRLHLDVLSAHNVEMSLDGQDFADVDVGFGGDQLQECQLPLGLGFGHLRLRVDDLESQGFGGELIVADGRHDAGDRVVAGLAGGDVVEQCQNGRLLAIDHAERRTLPAVNELQVGHAR